ncbi:MULTISPECIES: G5 domain-containing protein [unclassified Streptococcus]|uniref:G5 domain-containing protein n=1 Tax=unclassified Streptococcus TaxID=2608887 RepID=UPI0015629242|nr:MULTISPECIES: G5 domain-containing protein [unclassified Streptococcus]
MSRQSTKNKKYALRKIGKVFGSCVVATVITLGGVAIMAPNVVHANGNESGPGENNIEDLSSSDSGYEVIIPKGKQYVRNDEIESHTPVLKEEGYNGRSFILPKEGEDSYFFDHPMSELFTKLYDKDGDGNIDDEYKDPKYPHVVDSGLTGDGPNKPGVWKYNPDGKYAPSDGQIDDQDTIVVARKPITVDENADENVVKEDGSVVLSSEYRIHVNKGDHIDKKDDVYEIGTKPKEVVETTPKTTRYVGDSDTPYNTKVTSVDGRDGSVTKKTTYDLDEHTGQVTPHETITERVDKVDTIIKVGNKQVTTSEIPMTVTYKEDPTLEGGKTVVDAEGAPGEKETTTVYDVSETDGSLSNPQATEKTTKKMTPRVVRVGTKPKEVETPIPSPTTYEANPDLKKDEKKTKTQGTPGKRIQEITYKWIPNTDKVEEVPGGDGEEDPTPTVIEVGNVEKEVVETEITTRYIPDETKTRDEKEVVTPGSKGVHTKTTTYSVDANTGATHTPVVTEDDKPMEQKVVKVGIKPVETTEIIDITTKYIQDPELDYGKTVIDNPGSEGKIVTRTTYTLNEQDGTTTENQPTVQKTEMVQKVVRVGVKPKVEETPIPFPTRYERDDSVPNGQEVETVKGVDGKTVKKTTYTMNPDTGVVTQNEPTTETTQPVTRVVKVGTQPKVERTEIPFPTRYERDDSVPQGTEKEVTKGVNGETVKTTTYNIDETTGVVTPNEPTTETTDPVTHVVKRGTQPKVERTEIPFPTRYERDDSVPEGTEKEVTKGVNGETVKTTTYNIDETTGVVTPNEPTTETTDPVTRVVKKGTQPKVEKTPIPFPTRYERDDSVPEGTEEEVTAGKDGETVKTTTYNIDETTGVVTPNEPTTETTDPVTRVVKRGTQPKVEIPETPQPKPGETPETPQPEKPTNPEEAPTQPGQPSEPEDQPNLKVAPPTIAIVEEANKASIEVKAPKKDADTVKITYPKSDGSGNEILTLTKQPTGEWTLDKQPENVTLDKKTGTVTIPRESVVNKQKVQAQAKHKTSGYTPFVYAALSIEAANPEHPVTLWVDRAGKELREPVDGKQPAGEIAGYKWLSSRLEEGILTHTFEKVANGTPSSPESSTSHPRTPSSSPSTSTPEKPDKAETPAVRTVWRDENGKDLKVPSVDKQEAGEVPGYEFVESHREGDNLIVHVFRTKQAQTPAPKDQTPSPAPSKVSEQRGEAVATATSEKTVDSVTSTKTSDKAELPNTGTEANASLASAGIMTLLAGLGLGFFKKKED